MSALRRRGAAPHHAAGSRRARGGRRSAPARRGAGRGPGVGARIDLTGRVVLLVDDVLTTGATLSRCVAAVRAAGGAPVGAVVLAAAGSVSVAGARIRVPGTPSRAAVGPPPVAPRRSRVH
ncbi:phosphoribosyltransferase family protein [Litorihabitans aurantiacus]|uniref:phosphoribosyltransferase family protein n=1 Tax=Litorihabitans aurantiacus TaxID=1930061 RepID=UPI0024E0708F|nr:phosphoribosyltransferase family protein [Litorihabitans aurantiacus]